MLTDQIIDSSYRAHAAGVRAKAVQLTRDADVAADVTQEAFMRLLIEVRAGRTPNNISAWLYRTSTNLIISGARHAAVARRVGPSLARGVEPAGPEAIAVLREAQLEVHAGLAALSDTERRALLMAAHGATGREIASSLGRSDLATRTLLCRARKRLRASPGNSDLHPFGELIAAADASAARVSVGHLGRA